MILKVYLLISLNAQHQGIQGVSQITTNILVPARLFRFSRLVFILAPLTTSRPRVLTTVHRCCQHHWPSRICYPKPACYILGVSSYLLRIGSGYCLHYWLSSISLYPKVFQAPDQDYAPSFQCIHSAHSRLGMHWLGLTIPWFP